jgi:hypothetical protein
VVNSLATKCFNHICVLVGYQQFEEAEHAFHIYDTPNYMIISTMNMVWLEHGLGTGAGILFPQQKQHVTD